MADPSLDAADEEAAAAATDDARSSPVADSLKPLHDVASSPASSSPPSHPPSTASTEQSPPPSSSPPLPSPSLSPTDDCDGRNLYVDNLSLTSDVELRNLFLPYGRIVKSRLAVDSITRQPAGYGFVMFERREDATSAIDGLNQHVLGTKRLRVSLKRSKQQPPHSTPQQQRQAGRDSAEGSATSQADGTLASSAPLRSAVPSSSSHSAPSFPSSDPSTLSLSPSSTNLYMSGLPASWRQWDVESLFAPFGRVVDSRLLLDRLTGQPRGVAMLRFDSPDSATNAIAALHRVYTPPGMKQPITVKYAADRPSQQQQHAGTAQHAPRAAHSINPLSNLSAGSNVAAPSAPSAAPPRFSVVSSSPLASAPSSSAVHRPRPSSSISTSLRGMPLIRFLPSSSDSALAADGALSAHTQNGASPSPSTSSLSSKSASPPPTVSLNDAASTDSTASTRTSSLSPTVSQSSSPHSAARRISHSNGPSSALSPHALSTMPVSAAAAFHAPSRGGAETTAASLSASFTSQHHGHAVASFSPTAFPRQLNGVYAAGQHAQLTHAPHHSHWSSLATSGGPMQLHGHAPSQPFGASPHSGSQHMPGGQQHSLNGQTPRYSSVGLAAYAHSSTEARVRADKLAIRALARTVRTLTHYAAALFAHCSSIGSLSQATTR